MEMSKIYVIMTSKCREIDVCEHFKYHFFNPQQISNEVQNLINFIFFFFF